MKKRILAPVIAAVILALIGYFSFGVFVIQPIGAIPDGATIVYFRLGLNLPLVSSADGLLLEKTGSVSLFGRGMMMAALSKPIIARKVIALPYSRTLYLISTDGAEFKSAEDE